MENAIHITRYGEIPDIPLLLEQVLLVANHAMAPLAAQAACQDGGEEQPELLTASMVNNYVKRKLVPAPEKRRYNRDQVCLLIWVCLLKQVMGLDEIAAYLAALESRGPLASAYDGFCDDVEALLGTGTAPELPLDELVLAAAQAVASRLRLLQLVAAATPSMQEKE